MCSFNTNVCSIENMVNFTKLKLILHLGYVSLNFKTAALTKFKD